MDTDVGENGKALSGGQQQKVAILRGLLKKSSIRLLDEITAPFDSKSATEVLQSIQQACKGITSLMITHKLTEAQYVDKILVIDEGKVIAQGTHNELLAHCELYQELWNAYTSQDAEKRSQTEEVPVSTSSSTKKIMENLGGVAPVTISQQQARLTNEEDNTFFQFDLFHAAASKKPVDKKNVDIQSVLTS